MNYINTFKRLLVNSVNQVSTAKIDFDYAVTDTYIFQLLDKQGKIIALADTDEFYLCGKVTYLMSETPVFLSNSFTIANDVVTFSVNTYTAEYLAAITAPDSSINLEIGRKTSSDETYKVVLKCQATAQPRLYVVGLPAPFVMGGYYTVAEVDALLGSKLTNITSGNGRKFAGNNGVYGYPQNTGIEYALAVTGTAISFSPEQTIYSITPTANNVFTFNTALIPSGAVYDCELWITQSTVVTFTLPSITWIDDSIPDFSVAGTVWLALRYASGTWYGNVVKGA